MSSINILSPNIFFMWPSANFSGSRSHRFFPPQSCQTTFLISIVPPDTFVYFCSNFLGFLPKMPCSYFQVQIKHFESQIFGLTSRWRSIEAPEFLTVVLLFLLRMRWCLAHRFQLVDWIRLTSFWILYKVLLLNLHSKISISFPILLIFFVKHPLSF